jgi:hypothetical protein
MNGALDLAYYTELRHPGGAEEIIERFAAATRGLLGRLADDLRSEREGEFAGEPDPRLAPLAAAVERAAEHADVFASVALAGSDDPAADRVLRNVVANVVSDAGITEVAEVHASAPRARERKFDQHKGGALDGKYGDIADKLEALADLVGLETVLKLLALLARDIGLFGDEVEALSLAEVGQQLEAKLDFVIPRVEGLSQSGQTIEAIARDDQERGRQIQQELQRVEGKADNLGDLLGRTLVGEKWIVDPLRTVDRPNRVPDRDVKQELHDLEKQIEHIDRKLDDPPPTDDGNGNRNGDGHDEPAGEQERPVVLDSRLKKIYVYAENVFAAQSRTDRRRIRVRTRAFDLSGWLDLSRLRAGDVVEVQTRVSFAGRRDVLFARTRFDQPRLLAFAEFARGHEWIPGSNVLIVLRQPASADDYATPIEVAYQFLVESR